MMFAGTFGTSPFFFRICVDGIVRQYIPEVKIMSIIEVCNSSPINKNYSSARTTKKILQCGYY